MISGLRAKLEAASKTPWFIVGPPWNEGAPFINAGAEDPHGGEMVCDFVDYHSDDRPDETPRSEEDAALIVAAVNHLPALLEAAEAAQVVVTEYDLGHPFVGYSLDALRVALAALKNEDE